MLIVAHRGASYAYDDNSYEAITAAIAMKADIIEIDLRLTKDDFLVLSHDNKIVHNDQSLLVDQVDYADLPPHIVLFDELLDKVDRSVRFYLDIKCGENDEGEGEGKGEGESDGIKDLEDDVERYRTNLCNVLDKHPDMHFYVASFCIPFVRQFVSTINVALGVIFDEFDKEQYESLSNLSFLVVDIDTIEPDQILDYDVERYAYTVNCKETALKYAYCLDGIVTDNPNLLK